MLDGTYSEIIQAILTTVLIPLLGIIGAFLVKLIQKKFDEIDEKVKNENIQKYLDIAETLIIDAVIQTNQTYVDALKADGVFSAEDQALAFKKTKDNIILLLTKSAKDAITEVYGDFDTWIDLKIEAMVNQNRTEYIVEEVCPVE